MARKKNTKTPKSSLEIARSTGSAVAIAALSKSGAGKHGGSVRQKNRRDRKASKQALRNEW